MGETTPAVIGIDIGGTKTAVVLGNLAPSVMEKVTFPTEPLWGPERTLEKIESEVSRLMSAAERVDAIGVSCGGPLDAEKGLILSPPNLPGWDNIPITARLSEKFGIPVFLRNDADACALAEWKWGAGKGCSSMIFITFGTGLGAGLILGGRLYSGASGMAGEIGHIRLDKEGPSGYGKKGSFEGFCSGGGIARLAEIIIRRRVESGRATVFCRRFHGGKVSAKDVCEAAGEGDPAALEIMSISGENLGKGLSVLIDILNPERIVIGSIFTRCREFLQPYAEAVIEKEALGISASACEILPSALGEYIGDFGSLCAAGTYYESEERKG